MIDLGLATRREVKSAVPRRDAEPSGAGGADPCGLLEPACFNLYGKVKWKSP